MRSLSANEAKTKFGSMLVNVQSEPVEIVKNGTPVAVVISKNEYQRIEDMKLELVRSRFQDVEEDDLVEGRAFLEELESEKYD